MINHSLEIGLQLVFPAIISLLVVFLQDRSSIKKMQRKQEQIDIERNTIWNMEIQALKSTSTRTVEVLERIDNRLDDMSNRIVRIETKLSP